MFRYGLQVNTFIPEQNTSLKKFEKMYTSNRLTHYIGLDIHDI